MKHSSAKGTYQAKTNVLYNKIAASVIVVFIAKTRKFNQDVYWLKFRSNDVVVYLPTNPLTNCLSLFSCVWCVFGV